jgi:lactate permease
MRAALALIPVLSVLVLMLAVGWSAAKAGVVSAVIAVAIALVVFDFGAAADPFGRVEGSVGVLLEAAFITLTVVAIIGPALGIHHLQGATGATRRLQQGLAQLTPDPRLAALLIVWFFSLFMEGAAGFGTPVALAAPFLVAAGFRPVMAVTAALVGHAAGVSFGAVGTPVSAQSAISGVPGSELAAATAPYHVVFGWFLMAVVVVLITRTEPEGRPIRAWGALGAASFFVPYWIIARFVGPELPTLGAALIGAAIFVAVMVLTRRTEMGEMGETGETGAADSPEPDDQPSMSLTAAAAPYLTLIGLVLVTRLVPPVNDALSDIEITWTFGEAFSGSVQPLYHPGVILTASFVVGALVQRSSFSRTGRAVVEATSQLAPVVLALVAMVTIARTMSQAGMTVELASTAANTGAAWPLFAPVVGALGTFVTGSATASNILFTELQQDTAVAGGFPVNPLLGAQGFGAAVGNIVCPHNIVAAAATVGLSGQEGSILRKTFPVAAAYLAMGAAFAFVVAR